MAQALSGLTDDQRRRLQETFGGEVVMLNQAGQKLLQRGHVVALVCRRGREEFVDCLAHYEWIKWVGNRGVGL